ncbi:MAG TPA: hypothetical protein VGW38_24600 [Chloroflexota bacterium]|nr:hypothetical protein [Chloroflexota bacterium]
MIWAYGREPARKALALALVIAGTGSCRTTSDAALPAPPPIVDVIMTEYQFDYELPVPAGHVVFRVANEGQVPHRITMLALAEDTPPIQQQLSGSERRVATPLAGMPLQQPGETASFAIHLEPGVRYAAICFVTEDEESHAVLGMASEFRAGGPDTKPPTTPALPTGVQPEKTGN